MAADVSLLILSGGIGSRAGWHEPKQFRPINGHPMMAYSLMAAARVARIGEILINSPEGFEERTLSIAKLYAPHLPVRVFPCGKTRQESVQILTEMANFDTVMLHEAARPLIDAKTFEDLLAQETDNVGYFEPVPFSMCSLDADGAFVAKNVRREGVYNIQLPQRFNRRTLHDAHVAARRAGREFTEDAVLVTEMTGAKVLALPGNPKNIKVTCAADFQLAAQLMTEE